MEGQRFRIVSAAVLSLMLIIFAACSREPEKQDVATPAQQQSPAEAAPSPEVSSNPAAAKSTPVHPSKAPAAPVKPRTPAATTASSAPQPPAPVSVPPAPEQPGTQVSRVIPDPLPPIAPPPPEPVIRKVTLPSGTMVNVRMIDSISSDSDHIGQTFRASLADSIQLNGETVILKGSDVYVKLVDAKSAGNMTGQSELKVQLDRLVVGKQTYPVESNTYIQTGASQGQKTAKTVGIGAAVGAAIGAITGGKKGALIGAGVGGGGGAAVEAATKGEQVRIASESPLTFRLEAPIEVTVPTNERPRGY